MKTSLLSILVSIFSALSALAAAPTTKQLSLAALDVEPTTIALKERAIQFTALFQAELSAQPNLIFVERAQLDTALGELSLGSSGLVDPSSAAKVGQLTGAKVLVFSKAIGSVGEMTIIAKVVGTETGRVFAVTKTIGTNESAAGAKDLSEQVAKIVESHASELVSAEDSTASRDAKMRTLAAGKKLPAITIAIPEQHLTRTVRDPAAETEIARILGGLGFPLFEQAAADKATIRITGEAVSELGTRRGDFTSCRARVEIKVVEIASGKILLQDRQTEVAADISEAVAAKTALEHAGAKLAERIVETLANQSR